MEAHAVNPQYQQVIIFLATAALLVPSFHKLRISPILGFLLAGLLLGPNGLALLADQVPGLRYVVIDDSEGVRALAELGVVFLLFVIGLNLSFERLWAMRRLVFGLGGVQVGICALGIGLVAWGWGNSGQASIIIGLSLALSSTALAVQGLIERSAFATPAGRTAFAVLLFQDLMVVPILLLVSTFGGDYGGTELGGVALSLFESLAAVVVILVVGRIIVRPLYRFVSSRHSPELFVALTLLLIIGSALATAAIGMSMALGAFLAGLLLSETEYRHQIESDIEPFKGLLLGLFFMSVGMTIDLRMVADRFFWLIASVGGLIAVKTALNFVAARAFLLPTSIALPVAITLSEAGEFAFITLGLAAALGILSQPVAQFMVLVAGLTMMATPLLISLGIRTGKTMELRGHERIEAERSRVTDLEGHIVIAGCGRVGRTVAALLDAQGIPYRAVDMDGQAVARHKAHGVDVFYGDARRKPVLERLGAARASAFVVTLDQPDAALQAVRAGREISAGLQIFARARDLGHARALEQAGANHVVPEIAESCLDLAAKALSAVDLPQETIAAVVERARAEDYKGFPSGE